MVWIALMIGVLVYPSMITSFFTFFFSKNRALSDLSALLTNFGFLFFGDGPQSLHPSELVLCHIASRDLSSNRHGLRRLRIWKGHTHVLDRWCCGLTLRIACLVHGALLPRCVSPHGFSDFAFDSTNGYPGEGPWTLSTINAGSLEKHEEIYHQKVQCLAMQEIRIH